MTQTTTRIEAVQGILVSDFATRSLARQLKAVQHFLPLAAKSAKEDVENLYQLRDSSRRALVALNIYRDLLPSVRANWVEKQVKRILNATDEAYHDDVLEKRLMCEDSKSVNMRLLERVRVDRISSQKQVRQLYSRLKRKRQLDRRIAKLLKRVRHRGKHRGKSPKFEKWASPHLRSYVTNFIDAARKDLSQNDNLHVLRLQVLKLRSAIELLSSPLTDRLRSEAAAVLSEMQDKLGEFNEHALAALGIHRRIAVDGASCDINSLAEALAAEQKQIAMKRASFLAWWTLDREQALQASFDLMFESGDEASAGVADVELIGV